MAILPARTSIGVKLALRYGLTLLAALSLFALGVGSLVEERINSEAQLALRVQFADLVDGYEAAATAQGLPMAREWLHERATQRVAANERTLELGVEFRDVRGERVFASGSLASVEVPIDRRIIRGERAELLRAINVGRPYAFLSLSAPVSGGFLRVAVSTQRFARNASDVRSIFLWSIPVLLVISGLAGWALSRSALAPIAAITEAAREIGENAEGWIPTTGSGDELDQLADTLNEMVAGIRESVERTRRFSANAAHELRSPLGRIHHHLDQLDGAGSTGAGETEAAGIRTEVTLMNDRIESLLRLARFEQGLPDGQATALDLAEIAQDVGSFFEAEAEAGGVHFEMETEPLVMVFGDRSWLVSAVSNLVSNAIKYASRGDRVTIRVMGDATSARLDVVDTGPGMDPNAAETVFERFERATADHGIRGSGLGLAITREIARAHGGDVSLSTMLSHGSTFSLTLPRHHPNSAAGLKADR